MDLEPALLGYIKRTYLPDRFRKSCSNEAFTEKDLHFFAVGAAELSDAFTAGRHDLPKNYFNRKEARSAYLLYFTLTNAAKITKCLEEASRLTGFAGGRSEIKILDLGCGPGTGAIACSLFFKGSRATITGVDQNADILKDARSLFAAAGNPSHEFHTIAAPVRPAFLGDRLKGRRFDLVVAANILNEIGGVKEQRLLCQTLINDHLENNGLLIVVDPALQKTTRALMEVRNGLVADIVAPCLHCEPCPMLAFNRRDWCHFYLEWKCPETIRGVDRLLGIKHDYLKMAYLILKKRPPSPQPHRTMEEGGLWRVVSSPLNSKGKCEFVLCGKGRLKRISRLDRNRSEANAAFDRIRRGDVIRTDCSDRVTIEAPFNR